jgi:hypothetical protein
MKLTSNKSLAGVIQEDEEEAAEEEEDNDDGEDDEEWGHPSMAQIVARPQRVSVLRKKLSRGRR